MRNCGCDNNNKFKGNSGEMVESPIIIQQDYDIIPIISLEDDDTDDYNTDIIGCGCVEKVTSTTKKTETSKQQTPTTTELKKKVGDCGCHKKEQQEQPKPKPSDIVIDENYDNIPVIEIDKNGDISDDIIHPEHGGGENNCCCSHRRKDPTAPIIVEPGNDVPIALKLITSDDCRILDIDAYEIKNLEMYVNDTSVDYYIDLGFNNLLHSHIDSSVISEEGEYDIIVKGIWNDDDISFTFHNKIIVTKSKIEHPYELLKSKVSIPEQYIGNAVFIPAPYTYRTEEELQKEIAYYKEIIKALEEAKEQIIEERDKLVELCKETLPEIKDNTETILNDTSTIKELIYDVATKTDVSESEERIIGAISDIPETDLTPVINRLDSSVSGLGVITDKIDAIDAKLEETTDAEIDAVIDNLEE